MLFQNKVSPDAIIKKEQLPSETEAVLKSMGIAINNVFYDSENRKNQMDTSGSISSDNSGSFSKYFSWKYILRFLISGTNLRYNDARYRLLFRERIRMKGHRLFWIIMES